MAMPDRIWALPRSKRWVPAAETAEPQSIATTYIRADLVDELVKALGKTLHWAESRCPCNNEEPNPCPLCGASVENLEPCKSAENTLPRDLLTSLRKAAALTRIKGDEK